jgi:TPR repeat protein
VLIREKGVIGDKMTARLPRKNNTKLNLVALCLLLPLVGVPVFTEKLSADDDLKNQCKSTLEKARLWVRATDAKAPEDERIKVKKAVGAANKACTAAFKALPNDGNSLLNGAYAHFASGRKEEGVALIQKAAELGFPPAMVMVAKYMGRGEYLEKDAEGAWMLLIKTLKTDHAAAKIKAALEFLPGGVGPENPKRTKKVLQGLIDEGNSAAMIAYAMKVLNLQKAEIGSDSSKQGISLLERAALEKNDSQAAIYLSLLFNQGNVVRRDEGKAIEFAQLAIDAGVTRAYGTMGQIFQNQNDMKSAVKWFQKGAEKGDGFSQGMLGFMYSGGFGVEQDLEKAVHWWTKARWNGDRLAASYLQVHREKEAAEKAWKEEQNKQPNKN